MAGTLGSKAFGNALTRARASRGRQSAGLARRIDRYGSRLAWYGEQIKNDVTFSMNQRIRLVAQLLRDRIVINLSTPVVKVRVARQRDTTSRGGGPRGSTYTWVDPSSRSKPGDFPHAETTMLMKSIFFDVDKDERALRAIVGFPANATSAPKDIKSGTSLDYGVILETQMDRSFLVRTYNEMLPTMMKILTAPNAI